MKRKKNLLGMNWRVSIKLEILHNWLYAPQMFNWYKTTLCIAVRN